MERAKTTLLQAIWEELKQRKDIHAGYMPQDYLTLLDGEQTPVEILWDGGDRAPSPWPVQGSEV